MKVFTNLEFKEKCEWLVNDVPNYYHSEAGTFCNYNWNINKFMMDCVVSIKGLLWGFNAECNKPHGGAVYLSNGVADFSANDGINYCEDVSTNFNNIEIGEYLCMKGTPYSHAGIYLGNGKVFECTAGWGVNKCIISDIDKNGRRFYKGIEGVKWTYHGKLIYINYNTDLKYKIEDSVYFNAVYISSDSTVKLKPKIKFGKIVKIKNGARNPYLVENIGWINDECITSNKRYLNLNKSVKSWKVYKTPKYFNPYNTEDILIILNPNKYNGLTYEILEDLRNYHFKIKTYNKGIGYIAGNPYKYPCTITDYPEYENGVYNE